MFYAGRPDQLAAEVDEHLARARAAAPASAVSAGERLIAVVAPHAGHVYSGPTAGYSYAAIDPAAVRRVVLLGPAHYVPVDGIGLSSASAWRTPLGDVPLDAATAEDLRSHFDSVAPADEAHAPEHSLEVQVPFLQRVLDPGWELVPLIVGVDVPEDVAAVIGRCAALPATLIVVSTDLSHYLDHDSAVARDARTIDAILERRAAGIGGHDACGRYPLRGLLRAAERNDWSVRLLDARNSGDTAGDWDRVVGYAAFAVTARPRESLGMGDAPGDADPDNVAAESDTSVRNRGKIVPGGGGDRIPPDARATLLGLARRTISEALAHGGRRPSFDPSGWDPVLRQPGAAFVTLRSADGALLGCIGSLSARQALAADVAEHAYDAAFRDPRFPPMTAERAEGMVIDISVLGPTRAFPCQGYPDLLARVPVGSGVVVDAGRHRATFLPAVWQQLPEPAEFLAALWRKAGLDTGEWPPGTRIEIYDSEEFAEE
jgi:AmmeMemoRadiSam system protein B/AmmeMemoRadiSam system protein A